MKMAENSLFAILLRARWWISFAIAAALVLLSFVLLPDTFRLMGIVAGLAVGLSTGGAAILGVLTASASYIAAPAAIRLALLPSGSDAVHRASSRGVRPTARRS